MTTSRRHGAWVVGTTAVAIACLAMSGMTAHAVSVPAPGQASDVETPMQSVERIGSTAVSTSAKPYLMPRIPVWVTLGEGRDLGGVTVSVINAKGKKVGSAKANAKGIAMLKRSLLPNRYSLRITGGKAWKKLGAPLMSTGELLGSTNKVLFISPVTSIASRVATLTGENYAAALDHAKRGMSLREWLDSYQLAQVPQAFDHKAFLAWSRSHGGVDGAIKKLAQRIVKGQPVPDFSPMVWSNEAQQASARGLATVGGSVMEGVMTGAISYGTEMALGTTLGFESPEDEQLADINSELKTISNQLTELQDTMDDLIQLMEKTDLDVLTSAMGTIIGNTSNQWTLYIAATKEDPTSSSYDADMFSYAKSFYVLNANMGDFGDLFDGTGDGYLHDIYLYNDAPWWNQSDVNAIAAAIDYYGSRQAQATALLNEAWNFDLPGFTNPNYETPNYVLNADQDVYEPQNNDIYLSMPQSIDTATIVIPSTQTMYKIFPTTFSQVYGQTSTNYPDPYPTCSSMGDQVNPAQSFPAKQTSESAWNTTWTDVVPSGWTIQSNSILSSLSPSRQLPKSADDTTDVVTTYSLSSFVNGAPSAFAMVTTGFYPRAGFTKTTTQLYSLENYLFCYKSAVALADPTNWLIDFTADRSGSNVPANAPVSWETSPVPVGVLGAQKGQFEYVNP